MASITEKNEIKDRFMEAAAKWDHQSDSTIQAYLQTGMTLDDLISDLNQRISPLMLAASCNNQQMVSALLNNGAKINTLDHNGKTVLWYSNLNSTIVIDLLSKKANPHTRSNSGETLIMNAAAARSAPMVLTFISAGVDIDAKDNQGKSALVKVFEASHSVKALTGINDPRSDEVMDALIEKGADLDQHEIDFLKSNKGQPILDKIKIKRSQQKNELVNELIKLVSD